MLKQNIHHIIMGLVCSNVQWCQESGREENYCNEGTEKYCNAQDCRSEEIFPGPVLPLAIYIYR
jgi:hypothetical protein